MGARVRVFAAMSLLALCGRGDARAEIVYVAVGGTYPFAGAPRGGDPARIATRLGQTQGSVRLVDLTVHGATVRHLRESQLTRTLALRPHLVTVAIGPADVAEGVLLGSFARDLHVVTDLLRRAGATVAIATLPPAERILETPSPTFRRRVEAFNWAIRRGADRNGLRLADLGAAGLAVDTSWEEAVFAAIRRPPAASTPPSRVMERAPRVGAVIVPAEAVGAERLLAVRRRVESRGARRGVRWRGRTRRRPPRRSPWRHPAARSALRTDSGGGRGNDS